jgi:hypothetical protein
MTSCAWSPSSTTGALALTVTVAADAETPQPRMIATTAPPRDTNCIFMSMFSLPHVVRFGGCPISQ